MLGYSSIKKLLSGRAYSFLKEPNKLQQTTHSFFFYFYLSKKIRLDLAEDSHEVSSLIFSEKQ